MLRDDPAADIQKTIDTRLNALVGPQESARLKQSIGEGTLEQVVYQIDADQRELAARESGIRTQALVNSIDLVGPNPVGVLCDGWGTPAAFGEPKKNNPALGHSDLIAACRDYNDQVEILHDSQTHFSSLGPAPAAAIGFPVGFPVGSPGPGASKLPGALYATAREISTLDSLLVTQAKIVAAAQEALKQAAARVECAQAQATSPGIGDRLRDAASLLASFLGKKTPNSDVSEATDTDGARRECLNIADQGILSILRGNGPLAIDPTAVNKLLSATASLDPKSSLSALSSAIVEARARFSESTLGKSVVAVATSDPANPPKCDEDRVSCVAVRAVAILGYLGTYVQASAGRLPDTSASLVGLARARFAADFAGVEAGRLKKARELVELKLTGQIQEIDSLVEANTNQARGKTARAVRRIGIGWNNGRIPATVADWDLKNQDYVTWLSRQKILVTANYDVLEPGTVLLAQYAAGGITGEDVARWLQTGLLGWIGYGVN